jgi:hypothetical protein
MAIRACTVWSRHSLRLGGQHGEEGKGEEDGQEDREERRRQEEEGQEVSKVVDALGVSMSHTPTTSKSGRRHAGANGSAGSSRRQRASAERGHASRNLVVRTGNTLALSSRSAARRFRTCASIHAKVSRHAGLSREEQVRAGSLPCRWQTHFFAGRSPASISRRRPQ